MYEVLLDGFTRILLPVAPVFHEYDVAPEAIRVADSPVQTDVLPLIATLGFNTEILITVLLKHPFNSPITL